MGLAGDSCPLAREAEAECQGAESKENLALLCCIQLFSRERLVDGLLIWEAKSAGWDLFHYVDVQLLYGAGVEATKKHLSSHFEEAAAKA